MGSLVYEGDLAVSAAAAWEVLERYTRSELHIFSACHSEHQVGDYRVVTNAVDGSQIWERNVTVDPIRRRAVYAIPEFPGAEHHHAEMRVTPGIGAGCVLTWTTDLLPDALVDALRPAYDVMFAELIRAVNAYAPR